MIDVSKDLAIQLFKLLLSRTGRAAVIMGNRSVGACAAVVIGLIYIYTTILLVGTPFADEETWVLASLFPSPIFAIALLGGSLMILLVTACAVVGVALVLSSKISTTNQGHGAIELMSDGENKRSRYK